MPPDAFLILVFFSITQTTQACVRLEHCHKAELGGETLNETQVDGT